MLDERWKQLESIFLDGRDLSGDERENLLNDRASADPDLQAQLRGMWAGHESDEGVLQKPAARLDASPHSFSIGQTLADRFTVAAFLGAGGMGEVYEALDTRLGRSVAVKVLPRSTVEDHPHRLRLEREARALSQLNHPGICALYDLCWEGGQPLLIMELIKGQTLADRLSKGVLPARDLLSIARQIADALVYSHGRGIVHQDLKPGNIILTAEGLKLLDFGLARRMSTTMGGDTETADHSVVGTPGYMSPEQVQGISADARSDIFSFGALLFEMLTGRRAFQASSSITVLAAVLHLDPPRVSQLAPRVSPELERTVERCLRKDPARRFQHMDEVRAALQEVSETSETGPMASKPSHIKYKAALWLLPVVGVLAVGNWLAIQSRQTVPLAPPVVRPFSAETGVIAGPAFSPDGKQVVYFMYDEAGLKSSLFVKLVEGGTPLRISDGDHIDGSPIWSPDGHKIAFLRTVSETHEALCLISPLGGPVRQVTDIRLTEPDFQTPSKVLAWMPDSNHIVATERAAASAPYHLIMVSVDTGEKRTLTAPPESGAGNIEPAVSPDGRTLAFVGRPSAGGNHGHLFLLPLDGPGKPLEIATGLGHVSAPVWSQDGRFLVVKGASDIYADFNLFKVDPSGAKPPEPVSYIQDAIFDFALSGSNRLIHVRKRQDYDVWTLAAGQNATQAKPLVSSSYIESQPRYSPDGRRIAFISNRTGAFQLWIADSAGGNPMQLTTKQNVQVTRPSWSPDGKQVVFQAQTKNEAKEIYVIAVDGGAPRRLTNDQFDDVSPSWSRNGKTIYFSSNRTGKYQLYGMPSSGGAAAQLTKGGGVSPNESHDRALVYYLKDFRTKDVWRVSVPGGIEERLFGSTTYGNLSLGPTDLFFLVHSLDYKRNLIRRFPLNLASLAESNIRDVVDLGAGFISFLSVSSDGKSFLYHKRGQIQTDLMMVDNFR